MHRDGCPWHNQNSNVVQCVAQSQPDANVDFMLPQAHWTAPPTAPRCWSWSRTSNHRILLAILPQAHRTAPPAAACCWSWRGLSLLMPACPSRRRWCCCLTVPRRPSYRWGDPVSWFGVPFPCSLPFSLSPHTAADMHCHSRCHVTQHRYALLDVRTRHRPERLSTQITLRISNARCPRTGPRTVSSRSQASHGFAQSLRKAASGRRVAAPSTWSPRAAGAFALSNPPRCSLH